MTGSFRLRIGIISVVGNISVVIGDHFGGGDHFDGGDHFGGGTATQICLENEDISGRIAKVIKCY